MKLFEELSRRAWLLEIQQHLVDEQPGIENFTIAKFTEDGWYFKFELLADHGSNNKLNLHIRPWPWSTEPKSQVELNDDNDHSRLLLVSNDIEAVKEGISLLLKLFYDEGWID